MVYNLPQKIHPIELYSTSPISYVNSLAILKQWRNAIKEI